MTFTIHQTEIDLNKKKIVLWKKKKYITTTKNLLFASANTKDIVFFPVPVLNSYLKCTSALHYTKLLDTTLLYTSLHYTALQCY